MSHDFVAGKVTAQVLLGSLRQILLAFPLQWQSVAEVFLTGLCLSRRLNYNQQVVVEIQLFARIVIVMLNNMLLFF